jgi:hypothetical protein
LNGARGPRPPSSLQGPVGHLKFNALAIQKDDNPRVEDAFPQDQLGGGEEIT